MDMKTRKAKLLKAIREAVYVEIDVAGNIEFAVGITKREAKHLIEQNDDRSLCLNTLEQHGLNDWSIVRWDDGGIKLYHSEGIAQAEAEWIEEGCKDVRVDLV